MKSIYDIKYKDELLLDIHLPESEEFDLFVYIHGGGFTGGCGHEKHFDGPVWPTKGVIAVTVNYRLGPMGFMCLPQLKAEAGHTGNYALFDQLCALKWVRDNISSFGGDPKKVTLMGQSAGASCVQLHCQSSLSDGLFRSAVMSSGCGMASSMMKTAEKNYPFWTEVMSRLDCSSLEELRSVDAKRLFEVWQKAKKEVKGATMATFPVVDSYFVVKGASPRKIPYIVGSNSHDVSPPIMHSMAKGWGRKNDLVNYVYHFDRNLPGDNNGAWHSADLWYWFGTLNNCWRPMEEKDRIISNQMASYLCNFAKRGDPNGENIPIWKSYDKVEKVLCVGEGETKVAKPNSLKLWGIMLTNKAVGE